MDRWRLHLLSRDGGAKTESVSLEALSKWTIRRALNHTDAIFLLAIVAASQPPPPPTTTPLLEALKAEKSAQKDKETTLQDPTVTVSLSKKEVAKKKLPSRPLVVVPLHKLQAGVAYADEQEGKKAAAAAAQKASLQEEQGQGSGSGKGAAATGTAAAAPSGVKLPPPAPTSTSSGGHGARQWPPEEPHGHSHSGKGGVSSAPAPAGTSVGSAPGQAPPPAVTTESAPAGSPASGPSPLQGPCQCKNRPVIGLGRQFKAALNGAGVAVSAGSSSRPGNRKRRDKGGKSEAGPGAGMGHGSTESIGTGKAGKQKCREEHSHLPEVVLSILQCPAETVSPDVVIMQRQQSARGTEGSAVHRQGSPGSPSGPNDADGGGPAGSPGSGPGGRGRGSTRRGRGRGRGGNHGE